MHAGIKLYPCSICGKRFTQISSLARHKRIHERVKDDVKFHLQNNFNNSNLQKKDAIYKNKFVEGNAPSQQKVVKRQHYCKICGESFNFIFLLREHEKSHSETLECKNNKMSFQKTIEFKKQTEYNDNFDFFENEINIKKVLPLETIIYITSEQLKKINLENVEDNRNHISQENLCETKILADEELNISQKVTFKNEQTQFVQDTPHLSYQQKFHCKDCKISFAWKSTLNKHIANNHRPDGPQKFACDICNKIYNTSSQVNEHVKRDHLKQRNHVCSQCGKSFFKKYDLKIHGRIHTDERPYVCRACGKRFHHRSHIIRHERIHF
ncbi:zinc finger protein [Apis mellifera caucasica]|nr:zinc finger protein [Apis mellifera caucasica]KAG9431818.1 zinc finger protein [Apis mellifera carnica]